MKNERTLELWNARDGAARSVLYHGSSGLSSPTFSANGSGLACVCGSREVWYFDTRSSFRLWGVLLEGKADIVAIGGGCGLVAACAESDVTGVYFLDLQTGNQVAQVELGGVVEEVYEVLFTADSDSCVIATSAGVFRIDVHPGRLSKANRLPMRSAPGVAWHPIGACVSHDGRRVAYACKGGVRVFDATNGKQLTIGEIYNPAMRGDLLSSIDMAFLNQGSDIAMPVSDGRRVSFINCESASIRATTTVFDVAVSDLSVSVDSKTLIVATSERLHVFDLSADVLTDRGNCHDGAVSVMISRDGKRVLSTGAGSIRWWNADSGRLDDVKEDARRGMFGDDNERILGLAGHDRVHTWKSADGRMISESKLRTWRGGKVSFDDVVSDMRQRGQSGEFMYLVNGHAPWAWDREVDRCRPLAMLDTESEVILATSSDADVVCMVGGNSYWKLTPNDEWKRMAISGENYRFGNVAMSHDGSMLAGMAFQRLDDGDEQFIVAVWAVNSARLMQRLIVNECCADVMLRSTFASTPLAFSPDNREVAVGRDDGRIMFIDVETGGLRLTPRAHQGYVSSIAFSSTGRIASGGADGVVIVWRPETMDRRRNSIPQ